MGHVVSIDVELAQVVLADNFKRLRASDVLAVLFTLREAVHEALSLFVLDLNESIVVT